ncbi:YhdP family phospholipid transporter [Hydrogenovibrio halophilus]|uniref:YhdP family phospholipid transporter n=1 Tax=Hydrogenovibrio halophilus TaxID=373391 RepID=UPI0003767920|nr:DUF3971 domain-containing protein [Hydrogenovibrio halophilus]
MRRLLRRFIYLFFGLLLLYWLLVRGAITLIQMQPERFLGWTESGLGLSVQVAELKVDQTWLGAAFTFRELAFASGEGKETSGVEPRVRGQVAELSLDVNVFAPLLGWHHWGERLTVRDGRVAVSGTDTQKERTVSLQPLTRLPQFLHWKRVSLKSVVLQQGRQDGQTDRLVLHSVQTFQGARQTLQGQMTWQRGDTDVGLTLEGTFDLNPAGWLSDGDASVRLSQPLSLKHVYALMPGQVDAWQALPQGQLQARIHMQWQQRQLRDIRLQGQASELDWQNTESKDLPKTIGFEAHWLTQGQAGALDNWVLMVDRLALDHTYLSSISPIRVALTQRDQLRFSVAQLGLESLKPFYHYALAQVEESNAIDRVKALSVKSVSGLFDLSQLRLLSLRANIAQLHLVEKSGWPGLQVKDWALNYEEGQGRLEAKSPLTVQTSSLETGPVALSMAQPLRWQADHQAWQILPFALSVDDRFELRLSASGQSDGQVALDADTEIKALATLKRYLPYAVMDEELETWLKTALVKGENVRASAHLSGHWQDFPFLEQRGKFEVLASVDQAQLKFDPDWPMLTDFEARLRYVPHNLTIETPSARTLGASGKNIAVRIAGLDQKDIAVEISGEVEADAADAKRYLLASPLARNIGMETFLAEQVSLSGPVRVDLSEIWVPVDGHKGLSETVRGRVRLQGVRLRLFDQLAWQDARGAIDFTEKGIQADEVKALWGQTPLTIQARTDESNVAMTIQGTHSVTLPDASGELPWRTELTIPFDPEAETGSMTETQRPIRLSGEADLTGLTLAMPAPLNEKVLAAGQSRPDKALWQATIRSDQVDLSAWLPDLIHAQGQWRPDSDQSLALHRLGVNLGSSQPLSGDVSQAGVEVGGHLDELALEAWLDYWPRFEDWSQGLAALSPSKEVDKDEDASGVAWMRQRKWLPSHVTIDRLGYAQTPFHQVKLTWLGLPAKAGEADSPRVVYAAMADEWAFQALQTQQDRFKVDLARLDVTLSDDFAEKNLAAKTDCQPPDMLEDLTKDIAFSGRNIRINDRAVSSVAFRWLETPQSSRFEDLKIRIDEVQGRFQGAFAYDKTANRSQLKGTLRARDVADMTTWLGIKKGFEGEKGQVDMDLTWPGDLTCVTLERLAGSADFRFDDGVIKDAEPGLARVLGLLSVDSLMRRLRLDIRDVTDAGLLYSVIEGEGRFDKGHYRLSQLRMSAPSAKAEVSGDIDLVKETLNLDARVTPAIGGSLPTIAALSGLVTPVVGVAAYAISKLLPGLNQDLVTYQYKITGSLDKIAVSDGKMGVELIKKQTSGKEKSGATEPEGFDPLNWE